jgi:hypothetical protein
MNEPGYRLFNTALCPHQPGPLTHKISGTGEFGILRGRGIRTGAPSTRRNDRIRGVDKSLGTEAQVKNVRFAEYVAHIDSGSSNERGRCASKMNVRLETETPRNWLIAEGISE